MTNIEVKGPGSEPYGIPLFPNRTYEYASTLQTLYLLFVRKKFTLIV